MKYEEVKDRGRAAAEAMLASANYEDRCRAILSLAYYDRDWRWVHTECLRLLKEDTDRYVRGLAATCLGHLARIHRKLDLEIVKPALEQLKSDPELAGEWA